MNKKALYALLSGALFGLVGLIGMLMSVTLYEGIIFDGRSIVISVGGFFGGPIVALISGAMCGIYRFSLGGAGKWMGISVIAASALIGSVFYYLRKRHRWAIHPVALYIFGLLVHIAMLAMTSLLPKESFIITLKQIWLPVITIYPLATLLVCQMYLDIEKRYVTQKKLCESEERYRNYVNNSPLGVVITELDGTILDANPKAFEISGCSPDEILNKRLNGVFKPEYKKFAKDSTADIYQNKITNFEAELLNKAGKEIWCSFSAVLLENDRILWFIEDITGKKDSEKERFEIQRRILHVQKLESLGILAGGIAHDFNNILTAALGNIDLALSEVPPEAPILEQLNDVRSSILRAADLSRQMLSYSGKGKFVAEVLDLNGIVRSMQNLLKSTISKKIALNIELSEGLPKFTGDSTQISQVVMNLALNASESIEKNDGVVRIGTSVATLTEDDCANMPLFPDLIPGEYLCIEVSDNGIGMNDETVQKIFEPFFTTKFTGRGLGMSVVMGIVKGHKGAIRVRSRPGEGTTFCAYFPVSPNAETDRSEISEDSVPIRDDAGSVLFADDEEGIRNFVAKVLQKEKVPFYLASDGIEAIEVFQKNRDKIRLIVLDLTMPRLGGEDAYLEIRKIDPTVRVIVTSGFTEQELVGKFDADIAGFIQKPFTYQKLVNAIKSGLAR
jgi:PAS domain S-box-containing protein